MLRRGAEGGRQERVEDGHGLTSTHPISSSRQHRCVPGSAVGVRQRDPEARVEPEKHDAGAPPPPLLIGFQQETRLLGSASPWFASPMRTSELTPHQQSGLQSPNDAGSFEQGLCLFSGQKRLGSGQIPTPLRRKSASRSSRGRASQRTHHQDGRHQNAARCRPTAGARVQHPAPACCGRSGSRMSTGRDLAAGPDRAWPCREKACISVVPWLRHAANHSPGDLDPELHPARPAFDLAPRSP